MRVALLFSQSKLPRLHVRKIHSRPQSSRSASEKLLADAKEEESGPLPQKSSHLSALESQDENWTGDERIQDTVLRMLVDKYKPLRSGTIQTADEKLKRTPPTVSTVSLGSKEHFRTVEATVKPNSLTQPTSGSWSTETLLPGKEGHRPWHTEFKAPSHASSSVKLGAFSIRSSSPSPLDDKLRKEEKENRKRFEQVGKLQRARESTLDYRLGKSAVGGGSRPRPSTMKGWTSLVEDRIEKARVAGIFKTVKGRGQPMVHAVEERNPFIAREEFLMNRIVQRNGAAPPWVELQQTLDQSIHTFREILRQSWTRQAIRKLSTEHPAPILAQMTVSDIKSLRDPAWEQREQSYHDAAMNDVNSVVRKYNGVAPYAVRRPYYFRNVEVEKMYDDCAEDILKELERRASEGVDQVDGRPGAPNIPQGVPMRLRDLWRYMISKMMRWLSRTRG